ncbi:MAG: hypothetical protein NTV54_09235 [Ignavibacteriales bacterium]|nr:hypothetical protein [Ignavibacteriales bacterium]
MSARLAWHYSYSRTENAYNILLVVRNNSDEVIQARAAIAGTIRIEWLIPLELTGNIVKTRTDKLDVSNIKGARQYEPTTGMITLASGDSITLYYSWNLKMDDSTWLPYNPAFNAARKRDDHKYYQNFCYAGPSVRFFFARQAYRVQASVRLFNQTGIIYPPDLTFSSCYIYPYAGSAIAEDPCELIAFPDQSCEIYEATP